MNLKIILEKELNPKELEKLEILFRETGREILDSFLILTDSPELCRICREMDMAVAAILSGETAETEEKGQREGGRQTARTETKESGEAEETGEAGETEENGETEETERIEEGVLAQEFPGIRYAVTDTEELDEAYLERIWQRYRGIPWKICETARCLVRETVVEDVGPFYRIYQGKGITDYMENLYEDKEEEKQYIRDYIEKVYGFYGYGMWTVCLKETGEVIGRVGFSLREGFDEPELGYVIGVPWQGQGIATEVCRAILEYGRKELGFENIRVLMAPGNAASERLCRRLGFQYAETLILNNIVYKCYDIRR